MIHLGLIGCGEHAENGHAIPLARYQAQHPEEIDLAAVCDLQLTKAESFCHKYGFARAYQNFEEMLEREGLEGCIAVVPVEKIAEIGTRLLGMGVPCVLEKPLGSSLDQAKKLLDTARATATPNMVSVNRRFMPFLMQAIEWARNIGPLRYVRCTMVRHARVESEFIWTTAVHAVDALRHIAGPVASAGVHALAGMPAWYGIDLRFENGVVGRIDILPTAGMVEEVYELAGDGFRALVTSPFGARLGWRGFRDGELVMQVMEEGNDEVLSGCYQETAAFIAGLSGALYPSIAEVFPSVELCFRLAEQVKK